MDIVPNVPPHTHALVSLARSHLRHLEKDDAETLSTPQWTAAAQSAKTVAALKPPGQPIEAEDIPMVIGTGEADRRRHLYSSTPCAPSVAAAADESEVAVFIYNRRGRIQAANRTAAARQPRAWYPPFKTVSAMRMMGDEAWGSAERNDGESGRPGIFEAAAGWLVLLVFLVFLAGTAYLALRFFDVF
jgi:hypothetical protein